MATNTKAIPLQAEFDFYRTNQAEFVKKYEGKFVVIKEGRLLGAYPSHMMAIEETKTNHKMGSFLIQKCDRSSASTSQTFHSRVSFPFVR